MNQFKETRQIIPIRPSLIPSAVPSENPNILPQIENILKWAYKLDIYRSFRGYN